MLTWIPLRIICHKIQIIMDSKIRGGSSPTLVNKDHQVIEDRVLVIFIPLNTWDFDRLLVIFGLYLTWDLNVTCPIDNHKFYITSVHARVLTRWMNEYFIATHTSVQKCFVLHTASAVHVENRPWQRCGEDHRQSYESTWQTESTPPPQLFSAVHLALNIHSLSGAASICASYSVNSYICPRIRRYLGKMGAKPGTSS